MSFVCFTLLMLALNVTARMRCPRIGGNVTPLWFFISWLPSELPWAAGIFQAVCTLLYLLSGDDFGFAGFVALLLAMATMWSWYDLHLKTFTAGSTLQTALREGLGERFEQAPGTDLVVSAPSVIERGDWKRPFSFRRPGVQRLSDIAYGELPRQRLDIYRPSTAASASMLRPVLLHVHGGAWIVGHKQQQGQPLMQYLTQHGWICVDINYRLGPKHRFPDCLIDVKTAISWLKNNIEAYGGDPQFIAITGESAGGHLSSLAALTANHAQFQPGFESSDTRVQAAVPMYGIYDFTNSNHARDGVELDGFLEKYVMPMAHSANPEFWRNASPRFHASEDAPPMFVIHGSNDCLAFVEDARDLVATLRRNSLAPVLYAEIDGAQHGFEIFHAVRTEYTIEAIGRFLLACYSAHLADRAR